MGRTVGLAACPLVCWDCSLSTGQQGVSTSAWAEGWNGFQRRCALPPLAGYLFALRPRHHAGALCAAAPGTSHVLPGAGAEEGTACGRILPLSRQKGGCNYAF